MIRGEDHNLPADRVHFQLTASQHDQSRLLTCRALGSKYPTMERDVAQYWFSLVMICSMRHLLCGMCVRVGDASGASNWMVQ